MATTLALALMAGASYISTRSPVNQFPMPAGWTELVARRKKDSQTGFEATTFGNGIDIAHSTEIVISFAGTDPNNSNLFTSPDGKANAALAAGNWSEQLLQAAEYYLQIKAVNPNATITLTGHSLGGGLAALVGVFLSKGVRSCNATCQFEIQAIFNPICQLKIHYCPVNIQSSSNW
jgi:Lipase (class 3)